MGEGDGEGLGEAGRSVAEQGEVVGFAAVLHDRDALEGFEGADEDGFSAAFGTGDSVCAVVEAVDEVDVGVSHGAEEDAVAVGLADVGVGGRIMGAEIGFGFDDATEGGLVALEVGEVAAEQLFGDGDGVLGVECLGEYHAMWFLLYWCILLFDGAFCNDLSPFPRSYPQKIMDAFVF